MKKILFIITVLVAFNINIYALESITISASPIVISTKYIGVTVFHRDFDDSLAGFKITGDEAASSLITGTIFGINAIPTGHESDKAFDNDISTFFDYSQSDGGYTGVKLNSGNGKVITKIRFYPRGWEQYLIDRMIGGKFQGSNTGENEGYTDLYTIATTPNAEWNEVNIINSNAYTYIRYIGPNGSYGDVSEIEFYDDASALITGTIFGAIPIPSGHESDKAFDNDISTFFDYSQPDGGYTGVKLNSVNGKVITKIRFYPRGWEQYLIDRMIGGKFQGSNTGENEGYTDLYTIATTPNAEWNEVIINDLNAYTYFRYIGPDGSYCDVSEIEFYGYAKSTVGVINLTELDKTLNIYPNPVTSATVISLNTAELLNVSVSICNVVGQEVLSIHTHVQGESKIPIDLANQKNGLYIVKIHIGENVITKKIMK